MALIMGVEIPAAKRSCHARVMFESPRSGPPRKASFEKKSRSAIATALSRPNSGSGTMSSEAAMP
jgi:hypothetical protein